MKKYIVLLLALVLATSTAQATLRSVQKFEFFNNSGGLNDKLSPIVIKDNEASDLENVNFTLGGAIQKRDGYSSDNSANLAPCTGLYQYVQNDGSSFFVGVGGDNIYKMDAFDGMWDEITGGVTIASSSTTLFDFVTASNKMYATNQTNPVIQWDGSGDVSTLPAAPQGKWIEYHQNIVFIANIAGNPSRVQFSNVSDPTTWTATDWIDVGKDDGSGITGMVVLLDTLYIFKGSAIYRLSGTNRDDFVLSRMVTDTGCISGHSIQVIDNRIIFQDSDGIYIYDGGINVKKISIRIEDTLDGLIGTRNEFSVSANISRLNQYWLSVTDGSGTSHNTIVVYDYFHDAWTKYTGIEANAIATVFDTGNVEQLYTGDNTVGGAFLQNDGDNDDGRAIDAFYQTKWFRFPSIMQSEMVLRLIRVFAKDVGDWDLIVEARQDFSGDSVSNTMTLTGSSAVWDTGVWGTGIWGGESIIIGRFNVSLRESFFQLRFENSGIDQPFTIFGYSLYIESQDRV